jgi:hypothetical protein
MMNPAARVLFLDFDGVLHPVGCPQEERFCQRPRFESVMRQFPEVRIVISSSWRRIYKVDWLRSRFSRDIAERIVGTTQLWVPDELQSRYQEIVGFAGKHGLPGSSWLALDDSADQFPLGCQHLVLCDSRHGLTEEVSVLLAKRLGRLLEA